MNQLVCDVEVSMFLLYVLGSVSRDTSRSTHKSIVKGITSKLSSDILTKTNYRISIILNTWLGIKFTVIESYEEFQMIWLKLVIEGVRCFIEWAFHDNRGKGLNSRSTEKDWESSLKKNTLNRSILLKGVQSSYFWQLVSCFKHSSFICAPLKPMTLIFLKLNQ